MKRFLSIILALGVIVSLSAQKRTEVSKELRNKSVTKAYKQYKGPNYLVNPDNPTIRSKSTTIDESILGNSHYDLQSNSLLGNRMWLYSDGTIGAVWTRGVEEAPNFPDRGAGYNYYDGTSWGPAPTGPIESVRAGWPSYAAWGENGEIVVSHDFDAQTGGYLLIITRTEKGSGDWNESTLEGPDGHKIAWPRITTSGINNEIIHILYVTYPTGNGGTPYMGQDGALLYSRSSDGGATFDIMNEVLDGTGSDDYSGIRADEYTWAEPRTGVIAFVCAETWRDRNVNFPI